MNTECIYNIDLTTNSGETISVSSDDFNHFYIANIDEFGDEISYDVSSMSNNLYANFFMIKLLNDNKYETRDIIKSLFESKDIIKIGISFTNGRYQEFDLAKSRVVTNGKMINKYEETFYDENDLCIMVTDKKVKYKESLFA